MGADAHLVRRETLVGQCDRFVDDRFRVVVPVVLYSGRGVESETLARLARRPRKLVDDEVGNAFARRLTADVPQGELDAGVGDVVLAVAVVCRQQRRVVNVFANQPRFHL
ncbi:MAG: hypothetical protein ABGZ36_05820, partial [Actinomycetota bacterium]